MQTDWKFKVWQRVSATTRLCFPLKLNYPPCIKNNGPHIKIWITLNSITQIALGSNKLEDPTSDAALRLTVLYQISVDVIQPFKVSIILALITKHFALWGEECFGKINICFILQSPFKIIINKFKCHPGDWETSLFASKGSWPAGPVNICINFLSGMKKQNLVYSSCPDTMTIEIWQITKPQSWTEKW